MKRILLVFCSLSIITVSYAQKSTAFAITGAQKGHSNWSEVRLVDINTGEEVKSVYKKAQQVELLNATTGKPIAKKDPSSALTTEKNEITIHIINKNKDGSVVSERRIARRNPMEANLDEPFATTSAACAYDEKNERLYYTPMRINQLRYIDLKKNKIYYFEDVPFGALSSPHDVANQITRMVFASDGKGYALTNNGKHLYQFTTGRKPKIADLGSLTDDPANGKNSVHSSGGYGGDMVADAKKNLYLITANRNVFRISLETKVATFLGPITGLPRGYSTNGAAVEDDTKVIVSSSSNSSSYYRFDINSLQAEKIETGSKVYNASDLATSNLLFKKKKKEEEPAVVKEAAVEQKKVTAENSLANRIMIYPNPVTTGLVKLTFEDQPKGKYQVQLMEISGKMVNAKQYNILNKVQVEEFKLPELVAAGNYVMRVVNEANEVVSINKLVVQ